MSEEWEKEYEKNRQDFEKVKGTWAHELREHFNGFSQFVWDGFDRAIELMRDKGGMKAVDKFAWREYVLWDMQNKHDKECGTSSFPREKDDVDTEETT